MDIEQLVSNQRAYFRSGATLPLTDRHAALKRLRAAILSHQDGINAALKADLNKSPFETYMCETGLVLGELACARKNLASWARDWSVPTPAALFPARSVVHPEPYGVVLIMAPWNYPVMLSLAPLVGALAAGCCVVLKPSAYAPAASAVLAKIIAPAFDPRHVAVVEGGRQENKTLLEQKFDYIFFTGSAAVGREVMAKAAANLTPVTLELGGKSPVIVDQTADVKLAARRIAFGKFLNAGQTCVAPDYLLVHERVKDRLVKELLACVTAFFGEDPLENPDYVKMVNDKHYRRVQGLIAGERVLFGGQARYGKIAPTLLDGVTAESPVMQEEIFGPVLPVLTYSSLDEAINFINDRPRPLALYLFTRSKAVRRRVTREVSFGGGCVNDTVVHLANPHLPFGGVGESGMGGYHGKASFDTFTHYKSILKRAGWLDPPMRYHPYTRGKLLAVKFFVR